MKLDFEQYFADALTALIRRNGGSIEEALDDMKIKDGPTRGSIKHWYGWDEDEEEDEEEDVYTVLVTDGDGELVNTFEIDAPCRERAEEIVNNIVCKLTTKGSYNDIAVYTDDPEDGKILLCNLTRVGKVKNKDKNIEIMDGLTFTLREDEEDLPEKLDFYRPSIYGDDSLEHYIRKLLYNTYGYKAKSFKFDYDEQRIYVYQIVWSTEKGGK